MPAKSISKKSSAAMPENPAEPSLFEVASLAARWLPPLILPKNWAQLPSDELVIVGLDVADRYSRNADGITHLDESSWAVISRTAVRRARILLMQAVGERDRRLEENNCIVENWNARARRHKAEFEKLAKGQLSIPILTVLKHLGRARSDGTLMHYWCMYLREHPAAKHPDAPAVSDKERPCNKPLALLWQ